MQTELHRHLDVSIRLGTLLRLAQERGLEGLSTSIVEFRKRVVLSQPLNSLREVLDRFSLCQKVMDRPEVLEQIAFEVVEDCRTEGTRQVELRFAPAFVAAENQMTWEDVLDAFERGIKRGQKTYPDMNVGLLCIAVRDGGEEEVGRTLEFYLKHQTRFVGVDLAGNEVGYPLSAYQSMFRPILRNNSRITVHAGEACGPENIWEAIELLGAERIGHGIACVQDPQLMTYLARKGICLEMCPTSNWLTHAVTDLAHHPLKQALRAGVSVSINTDDPTVFGVSLPSEIQVCREKMGLTEGEIRKCLENAAGASFLSK